MGSQCLLQPGIEVKLFWSSKLDFHEFPVVRVQKIIALAGNN